MLAWTSEEAAQRDQFVATVALKNHCWAIVGDEGLARVPAPRFPDRHVHLVWSSREEAEKWADVLVTRPRLRKISLSEMLTEMLPKLADMRRLVGPDWGSEPVEPAIEPRELDRHLRKGLLADVISAAHRHGHLFVLRNADGPACMPSRLSATTEMLPVFADRRAAEEAGQTQIPGTTPVRVSLSDFQSRVLMWCAETRRTVAPGFMPGPGIIEMQPWELKSSLAAPAATVTGDTDTRAVSNVA